MSKLMNCTRPCYTLYELGKRLPDLEMIYDIANYYNLDVTDFFLESPTAFLSKISTKIPDTMFKR